MGRRLFTLLLAATAATTSANGGAPASDNKGTDFFVAFPQNVTGTTSSHTLTLFLAADEATTVEISGPEVKPTLFPVAQASVLEVVFENTNPQTSLVNQVGNEGIRVRSIEAPIAVFGLNWRMGMGASGGAYLGLPRNVLGTRYRTIQRPGTGAGRASQVTVVGTEDGTTVQITTPVDVPGVTTAGQPYQFLMNRLQTFLLQLDVGDLTGTLVTADKPIAVFSGNQNSPVNGGSIDHMVEQMVPVSDWGDEFIITPIAPATIGKSVVSVLAHENGTRIEVELDGTTIGKTLVAGEVHEYEQLASSWSRVTGSKPVLVAQFKRGDSTTTDPFSMLVPPVTQYSGAYLFKTPCFLTLGKCTVSSWLNVVVKAGDEVNLRLNNAPIPIWTTVNGYKYARVQLEAGAQQDLAHPDPAVQFGASAYGHAQFEAYGYAAGRRVTDDTPPVVSPVDDLTLEATGPGGATATWDTPIATDFGRGELPVTCTPPSGSMIALGTQVVECSATDPGGHTTAISFTVTVQDTTPPELMLPADIVVHASHPNGAVVVYDVSATDIVDLDVDVDCGPPSGSVFPLGPDGLTFTSVVTCTAADDFGNSSTGQFTVTVTNAAPVCSAIPSVPEIWPPNQRLVPIGIGGVLDPDNDPVTIRIDSIFQDEPTNDAGDGNTAIDGFGVGTGAAQARAERSGGGNGRVYHIGFTATDRFGARCTGGVTVGVPHDQGRGPGGARSGGAIDDGALYDSTAP